MWCRHVVPPCGAARSYLTDLELAVPSPTDRTRARRVGPRLRRDRSPTRGTIAATFVDAQAVVAARAALDSLAPGISVDLTELAPTSEAFDRFTDRLAARYAAVGAAVGTAVLAILTYVIAAAATTVPGMALPSAAAVAFTGGPFFGSFAGFALGTHRGAAVNGQLRDALRADAAAGRVVLARTAEPELVAAVLARYQDRREPLAA
jgi:hypothetical protein